MEWELILVAVCLPLSIATIFPTSNVRRLALVSIVFMLGIRYVLWRLISFPWEQDFGNPEWLWWLLVLTIELAVIIEVALFLVTVTWLSSRTADANEAESILRKRWLDLGNQSIPSVDIFITTYNEGMEVLEKSILGALRIDYPTFHVWVLDDGKRDWLKQYCQQAGVRYLARSDNKGAKAGNINNALHHSNADLVMIFDADFVCYRNAIWRVAGLFDDPSIATVQTPQNFYNPDALQHNLGIAAFWSDEQSYFFRLVARGRDALGVAFCCGSCSIHRRTILQAMDGFPTNSVTEDILLTITLCSHGWRTIFFEEPISIGLAAESLGSYFIQRKRWSRGGIQVAWLMLKKRGLTVKQRIFFFPYSWITQYNSRLFFQAIPIIFFILGFAPLPDVEIQPILHFQAPFLLSLSITMMLLSDGHYLPVFSEAISLFNSFELAPEILAAMISPFGKAFAVTPKGSDSLISISGPYLQTMLPASILLGFNILILFQIIFAFGESVSGSSQGLLAYGCLWCCFNSVLLVITILISVQRSQPRLEHRMLIQRPCKLVSSCGTTYDAFLNNLSVTGALCEIRNPIFNFPNEDLVLELDNKIQIPIHRICRESKDQLAFNFAELSLSNKKEIISYAFSGDFTAAEQPLAINPMKTLMKIIAEIANVKPRQPRPRKLY